jgi:hypothetical protein
LRDNDPVRTLLIIPVAIALALAAGFATCGAMSIHAPTREMIAAGIVCLIASELAFVPILLKRGSSQGEVAQAALTGTIVHLFGCCVLGGGLIMTKAFSLGPAFVYWLLGLYWLTLIVLVFGLIRAIKAAPIAAVGAGSPRPSN